jgi:hypothetical protein
VIVCKCGCGTAVGEGRTFVDKAHQLDWQRRITEKNRPEAQVPEERVAWPSFDDVLSGTFSLICVVLKIAAYFGAVIGSFYLLIKLVKWAWYA